MTHVDELQKKYPSIPREIIVRFDVLRLGLRDNDDLDKVSAWTPGLWGYQSYERDVSLEEMAKQRPHRFKEGLILLPPITFFIRNGLAVKLCRSTKSIYEIRDIGGGRFAIFEGGEKVEEVFFYGPKPRTGPEPLTSKGTPIGRLVAGDDCCFAVVALRSCEYFSAGEECKFCTFNPAHEQVRRLGLYRPVTIDLEDTVEAYKIRSSEIRLMEGCFMMGGLRNNEREAKIHIDFIEQIGKAAPYKPNFVCITQETTRKDMQRLKDVGLESLRIEQEVWGRQLFEDICPGKASHAPYERWLECMQEAVEIFGFGSVGGQIMTGLNMMSPNAPKTWQEGRDSHIEANRWMIKYGIFAFSSFLRLEKGAVYGDDMSNWEKIPPTEYQLDMALAHHEACEEFGMYERVNRLMENLPFHGGNGGYYGELGKLARCGDMGKWVSTFIPDDLNWLAKCMASTQLPANSQ